MPAFTARCACGDVFRVDEHDVGRRLKCRRCGRVVKVRLPRRTMRARLDDARRSLKRTRREIAKFWRDRRTPAAVHDIPVPLRGTTTGKGVQLLAFLSIAYLAAVAVIATLMWGLGDRWWPATVLLFIGRWIYLTPLAILIPAAIVLQRKLLVPLLIGAVIVMGPIMGFSIGWGRLLPGVAGLPLRVVTFNVEGGDELTYPLPFLLDRWKPDIVALQECSPSLADEIGHLDGWYHHTVRELCLLSRFPIEDASVMDRSVLERIHRDEMAGIGGSGDVARYRIRTPNGTISFTNLHLETPRKGFEGLRGKDMRRMRDNTELRDIESGLAREWVGRGELPLLVAGDFNTPVESRIFQESWGDLTDVFSRAGWGLGRTKFNGWIRVRIDHVLMGPGWRANRVVVDQDLGSDHRPVIADLTLAKPADGRASIATGIRLRHAGGSSTSNHLTRMEATE